MDWFVFDPDEGGPIFTCVDDLKGKQKVLEYLTKNFPQDTSLSPVEAIVIRGERMKFVPPQNAGTLVEVKADG